MLKKVLGITLSAMIAVSAFTGCGGSSSSSAGSASGSAAASGSTASVEYPKMKLNMSTTVGEQSNATIVGKQFCEMLSEKSGGNIQATMYSSDQLSGGNMAKGVEMIAGGQIDCAFEPVDVLASNIAPELLTVSLPWLFADYDEAKAAVNEGAGFDYINSTLEAQGIEYLGAIHNGFRQLTNSKHEITSPDDMKNLKMRVPGGEVFVKAFQIFGCDPVSMSFSELFTALQQGTVDGQENGYDLITTNKFYEVQSYTTGWNYSYGAFGLVFNKAKWDSFDDNTKALIEECAKEVIDTGCQNVVDNEATQKQTIVDYQSNLLTDLTDEQVQVFKDKLASEGYYQYFLDLYGEDAFNAFGAKEKFGL